MTWRVVVLISGAGSNAEALLSRLDDTPELGVEVVAMGSDVEAPGLDFARHRGIPVFVTAFGEYPSRDEWGEALSRVLESYSPDLIILSGFMRLLPARVVEAFSPRIINTHPAFLPEFPGAHGVRDALAAGVSETGASVIVVDNGIDTGPILAQERVPIHPGDTEETLHQRIKEVERRLLLEVVSGVASGTIDLASPTEGHHS